MTKQITRRAFGRAAATTGLAALATPFLVRRAHAQSGELNVWAYDGFVTDDFRDAFEDNTGIKVNIRLMTDQGEMFNLMKAEQGDYSADIVSCAGHRFYQFVDADLLSPIDPAKLANWDKVEEEYATASWVSRSGSVWGVPLVVVSSGLLYNTEVIKDRPDSWAIMFDENYAKQTAYQIQDFFPMVMGYLGHDGSAVSYGDDVAAAQKAVDETRDFLIEHKHLVRRYYDAATEVQQMMVTGDIALAQAGSGPSSQLIIDGFSAGYTIPKEGGQAYAYGLNVVNGAKNMDNAYIFLNALLGDPENGASIVRSTGLSSTIKGTEALLTPQEREALSLTSEERSRLSWVNVETAAFIFDLIDKAAEEIRAA